MRSRAVRLLTLLSLLVAPLAVASSTESAQADDPGQYVERWCGVPVVAPCLISVKRNGVPLTESDSQFEVQSTGQLVVSGFNYFGFLVAHPAGRRHWH